MYICLNCDNVFEQSKHYIETHALDSPPYEEWGGCPKCGGAYSETWKCDICDRYICGDYVQVYRLKICEKCYLIRSIGEI